MLDRCIHRPTAYNGDGLIYYRGGRLATATVFYSVVGMSRLVAEGISASIESPLYSLTDRFSSQPEGWQRSARKAVRSFDLGDLVSGNVAFRRGDRLVVVCPYWGGPVVPAVSGFVRAVDLTGVAVVLVLVRKAGGGHDLAAQLADDAVRQGGVIAGTFWVSTWMRGQRQLRQLGLRLGQRISKVNAGTSESLQEQLGHAIDHEEEAQGRCRQLVSMTPDHKLKKLFSSLAADSAAHVQGLQQLYRVYTGVVHEGPGANLARLKAEQVLDYSALVRAVAGLVEAERVIFEDYRSIERHFAGQMDVVQSMQALKKSQLRLCRKVNRLSSRLNHT